MTFFFKCNGIYGEWGLYHEELRICLWRMKNIGMINCVIGQFQGMYTIICRRTPHGRMKNPENFSTILKGFSFAFPFLTLRLDKGMVCSVLSNASLFETVRHACIMHQLPYTSLICQVHKKDRATVLYNYEVFNVQLYT